MLSIDLGKKNLGWCYLYSNNYEHICEFGTLNVDEDQNEYIVIHRCKKLNDFLNNMISRFPKIELVIIEKQVGNNQICQCLMYSLASLAIQVGFEVYIFPPVLKFTAINQKFDTKNRAHKKLSIENCRKFLEKYFPEKITNFCHLQKKDDVADAFNMAIIYGLLHNYLWINIEEYKAVIFYESNRITIKA